MNHTLVKAASLTGLLFLLGVSAWARPSDHKTRTTIPPSRITITNMVSVSSIPEVLRGTNLITTGTAPAAPMVFVGSNAGTKAPWQKHLTLGPGDTLSILMLDHPMLDRNGLTIAPDGRLTYLEVQDIMAAGLTVDELQQKLEKALSQYYTYPRITIAPLYTKSKKITILGEVVEVGVYPLNKPLTILEAVAQAGGFQTGVNQTEQSELADLPRSILIRNRQRIPVDFEKLFNNGDLSQNYLLEPGDFLFFPSSAVNNVYVLGSVVYPGEQGIAGTMTVVSAITKAGGFGPDAYQSRVLVVRGSVNKPERFVVNVADILSGKAKDFPLQPTDLVYVSDHPWTQVEELADIAATAFLRSMVISWTGSNLGTIIAHPILPALP
jgi:protein involved in polysaccharide export with SLBB domain